MSSKVILVLGAGPNVGLSIVKHFSENGYKTTAVSRNPTAELSKIADLALSADFSKPESIKLIFDEVKSKLGVPNVVVYNGWLFHFNSAILIIYIDAMSSVWKSHASRPIHGPTRGLHRG